MMDLLTIADGGMDYAAYRAVVDECVAQHRTTGSEQTPGRIEATRLNQARMRRWDKTLKLSPAALRSVGTARSQTWLALTETWCGDAAQNLPAIAAMAAASGSTIRLRLVLRDEHPVLMDRYLTQGSRSIPRLIAIDAQGQEIFNWGPRPAAAQAIVMEDKAKPVGARMPYEALKELVHRWYFADAALTVQAEFAALLLSAGAKG